MTTKFGWCLTGHHPLCPAFIPDQICSCDCHKSQATDPKESETTK